MVFKCKFSGCKFNQKDSLTSSQGRPISIFKFPDKNEHPDLFLNWISFCKISESDVTNSTRLCELHFSEGKLNKNGQRTRLTPGAVPEICTEKNIKSFGNSSLVLGSAERSFKTGILDANQNFIQNISDQAVPSNSLGDVLCSFISDNSGEIDKFFEPKIISNKQNQNRVIAEEVCVPRQKIDLADIVKIINSRKSDLFTIKQLSNYIIVNIQQTTPPFPTLVVQVFNNKSFKVYHNSKQIDNKKFLFLIKRAYYLASIEEVNSFFDFLVENFNMLIEHDVIPHNVVHKNSSEEEIFLNFFYEEQIKLQNTPANGRRYSQDMLTFALGIYNKSPATYGELLKTFALPDCRTLRSYSSPLNSSVYDKQANIEYLKIQFNKLEPHERFVTLKFDEVQIKQNIEFKNHRISGYSENNQGEAAKHVQAFFITSVSSQYEEVVRLVPVTNNNTSFLFDCLKDVLVDLETIGYIILCLPSDNNRVSRKLLSKAIRVPRIQRPY